MITCTWDCPKMGVMLTWALTTSKVVPSFTVTWSWSRSVPSNGSGSDGWMTTNPIRLPGSGTSAIWLQSGAGGVAPLQLPAVSVPSDWPDWKSGWSTNAGPVKNNGFTVPDAGMVKRPASLMVVVAGLSVVVRTVYVTLVRLKEKVFGLKLTSVTPSARTDAPPMGTRVVPSSQYTKPVVGFGVVNRAKLTRRAWSAATASVIASGLYPVFDAVTV